MDTTTCTEISIALVKDLYTILKLRENDYYTSRDEYIACIESLGIQCYYCASEASDIDNYYFKLEENCNHCENDFVSVEANHFQQFLLKEATYQMESTESGQAQTDEADPKDQDRAMHCHTAVNIQPAQQVVRKSFIPTEPTMINILERQYLYSSGQIWSTSNTVGAPIFTSLVPTDFTSGTFPWTGIFEYHSVVRGSINFEVRLNTNPFVCGQLVLVAVPVNCGFGFTTSIEVYPHSYLSAGFETTANLIVPFVSAHNTFVNTVAAHRPENNEFRIYVWNPLKVASSQPTSYTYSVWVNFVDLELGIKMPLTATRAIYQSGAAEHKSMLGSIVGAVGSGIKSLNIPIVSDIAKIIGHVTGLFDAPLLAESTQNLGMVVDVPFTGTDMRVLKDDHAESTIYEEISLLKYVQTYGRIHLISWTTADTSSSLLGRFTTSLNLQNNTPAFASLSNNLLSVSRGFQLWRGTLKFKIQVVATRFHQGQLLISWTPFGVCTTLNIAKSVYYTSMDIGVDNVLEIEIPFLYPGEFMDTNRPAHGAVEIWIQNPLVAPNNVSTTVDVNIWMAAGDDFEFCAFRNVKESVYQAGEISASGEGLSKVWKPLVGNQTKPIRMGNHMELVHYLRRPMFINMWEFTTVNSGVGSQHIATLPLFPRAIASYLPVQAQLASGGGRWTFFTNLPLNAAVLFTARMHYSVSSQFSFVTSSTPVANDPFAIHGGLALQNAQSPMERYIRLEIPMYTPMEYYDVFRDTDPLIYLPVIDLSVMAHEVITFHCAAYWSAADDFRLYWPLASLYIAFPPPLQDVVVNKDHVVDLDNLEKHNPELVQYVTSREIAGLDAFPSFQELDNRRREQDPPPERERPTPTKEGQMQSLDIKPCEFQGSILDIFTEIKDYILNIHRRLKAGWQQFVDVFNAGCEAVKFITDAKIWGSVIRDALEFIAANLLPAITSLYTAWNADGVIKMAALAHLASIAFNVSCPDKPTEGSGLVGGHKVAEMNGLLEDLASVSDVISSVSRGFCKTILTKLGCWMAPDYDTYIRRMTTGIQVDSWEYCVKVFGHSILYFLHGKSLNTEWERQQRLPISEAIKNFNQDVADGCFDGSSMDVMRRGKTNREHLKSYYDATQKIIDLATEMTIPNAFYRTTEDIKSLYHSSMRKARVDISQPEPVGIFLCGDPGCAKSFFASRILPPLVLYHTDLPVSENLVFEYPVGDDKKFWDNYAQQPFVLHDEFLQERDSKDAMIALSNISSSRPTINMASLEEKGMVFDSHFYMCTSNETNLQNVTTILSVDAVKRRFSDFAFFMSVREDYTKDGKPDVDRISDELLSEKCASIEDKMNLCDRIWQFKRVLQGPIFGKDEYVKASIFIPAIARRYQHTIKVYDKMTTFSKNMCTFIKNARPQGDEYDDYTLAAETVSNISTIDEFSPIETISNTPSIDSILTSTDACPRVGDFLDSILTKDKLEPIRRDMRELFVDMMTEGDDIEILADYKVQCDIIIKAYSFYFRNGYDYSLLVALLPSEPNICTAIDGLYKVEKVKPVTWVGVVKVLSLVGAGATAIAALIYGLSKTIKMLIPQLQSYTGETILSKIKAAKPKLSILKAVALQNGGNYHETHTLIHKNMVVIEISRGDSPHVKTINAIFLDDRTLVCNTHLINTFFDWADQGLDVIATVTYKHKNGGESYPLRLERGLTSRVLNKGIASDVTLVRTTVPFRGMRSIWKFVANKKDFITFGRQECYIRGGNTTVHGTDDVVGYVAAFTRFLGADGIYLEVDSKDRTVAGDCGRPYLLSSSGFHRPLFGIHACLTRDSLGAAPLILEDLESARKAFLDCVNLEPADDLIEFQDTTCRYWDSQLPIYDNLKCNGINISHHNPNVTNFRPLTFEGVRVKHPEWECDVLPAALKPSNGVHPLISNATKYEPNSYYGVDTKTHNEIVNFLSIKFENHDNFKQVYDIDTAINGNGIMQPLKYSTGCGYWSQFGFKDGKTDFFEALPIETDPITGEMMPTRRKFSQKALQHVIPMWGRSFVDHLEFCEEEITNKRLFTTFWISTNKDELRPAEKVRAVKTRVFEQPGLEYTLLVRKFFGGFLDYFKSHSGFTFYHGIGQDKECVWKAYHDVLRNHSVYGNAFDYKNWDGSVSQDAFQFFEDVVTRFYDDKGLPSCHARMCLLRILRDAHHVMGPYYFRSSKGNKSGNPFTDVFNSVCNFYVMALAYVKSKAVAGLAPSMVDFDYNIKMLTYGDDIVMTVKPSALDYYNGRTIQDILRLYGYIITDASKTAEIRPYVEFRELTFLKSPFVLDEDGVCLSPIPKKDIYKELCFAPKQQIGDKLDVQQRIQNVCRFMAHHGADALTVFKNQLRDRGIPRVWLVENFESFKDDLKQKQNQASTY